MELYTYPCKLNTPTAVALGRFDGVHLAHKAVISAAAECSNKGLSPTVFTFCDNPGKAHTEILSTEGEKRELIEACGAEVLVNASFSSVRELTAEEFVRDVLSIQLCAKEVFCGYNYRFGKGACADANTLRKLCEEQGIAVTCVPEVIVEGESVSSTAIRNLLAEGNVSKANKLLGRDYTLSGEVIHGRGLGRTMDTPTLNINVQREKLLPKFGVYAAYVCMGDRVCKSVCNIGVKPTVGSDVPTVEAYLLDFSGDFYGEVASLKLVEFLRQEEKFEGLQDLKNAIQNDVINATAVLSRSNV